MLTILQQYVDRIKSVPGRMTHSNAFNFVEHFVDKRGGQIGRFIILLFLVFLWFPLFIVTLMSFAPGVLSFPPETLTLEWYHEFINNSRAMSATRTSFIVTAIAVPVGVFFATLAAYGFERYAFRGRSLLGLLLVLPIIVPLVVAGAALTLFLDQIGIGSGFQSVVLAHIVRVIPFATLVILPSFIALDKSLEEASLDLGANEIQTFFNVTLPNVIPGIIAGAFLAFAISFNEFIYTLFTRDTRTTTLPIFIWNEIQHQATPEINVISVFFILIALGAVALAVAFTNVEFVARRDAEAIDDDE